MQEQDPNQNQPQETKFTHKKKSKKKSLLLVLIILIVLATSLFFLLRSPEDETSKPESEPLESQELSSPTPTPTPEVVDRSEIKIEILNGTGIARQAALLKEKLEELGYTGIETANADDQTHQTTTVSYSPSIPNQIKDEIQAELEDIYQNVETETSASDKADIIIIVGLRPGQSLPTPTPETKPSPTPEATDSATPSPTPTT